MKNTNISNKNIFITFLDSLGVKYTKKNSNKYFNEHPHKYSLFGLSKMLSEFKIENVALRIQDKEDFLKELRIPFIAHIGTDFVVVTRVTATDISYIWNGQKIDIAQKEFCKQWTGVVLLAQPDKNSQEPDLKKHLKEEKLQTLKSAILLTAFILLVFLLYVSQQVMHTNISFNILLLINIIGIYITYLLTVKQMKVESTYADKICSLFKQSDCNNILEDDVSKLFGIISWSEIGLGYFITNASILLLFPHLISYIFLINIFILPYTIWSIWYQKIKAKQWCALCLIVQILIWSIFLVNFVFESLSLPSFKLIDILIIICLYIIPTLIANFLVSGFSKSENAEQINQEINSIKATEDVFVSLLKKQPHYEVSRNTSQIILGNPEAKIWITVLTNPHCNPCAEMHTRIDKLLRDNDNICVQYIFLDFNKNLDSSSKFLISAYLNEKDKFQNLLKKWFEYGRNDKNKFFEQYKSNIPIGTVIEELTKHEEWKKETGFKTTPTILINGYKLPPNYKIEDIRYFKELDL